MCHNKIQEDIIPARTTPTDVQALLNAIETSLDDDKADDIVIINLTGKCSFADAMIVASGRSQRHVASLASNLQDKLKQSGHVPLSVEGMENADWVLIDMGDVIVHLFKPETREFYNIEKMWSIPAIVSDTSEVHA